jgi:hypothetical protein
MSTAQIAQIVTAVLSWPATLARQEHPHALGFQLIEHCIKLANGGLALVNQQDGLVNVPWALFDFAQSARIIGALLTGNELSEASLEKLVLAAAQAEGQVQTPAPLTPEAKEQTEIEATNRRNQQIAGTILATVEASMRVAVALERSQTGSTIQANLDASYRYILANIGSMARLAHYYLYAATQEHQQWLMGLLVLNAIAIGVSFYQYRKFGPQIEEQHRHMAPLAQQRPLIEGVAPTNDAAFDHATFATAFGEYARDCAHLPPAANTLAQHIDDFCTAGQVAPFFTETDTGRHYRQHFISFTEPRLQHNPNAIRQNTRAFADGFRNFTAQQERELAPIRRTHPLSASDAQPVVNRDFPFNAFTVCCRAFVLQHQKFNNAGDFIAAFTNFCEQQGIANLFDEADPVLRRHREYLATFWVNGAQNNPFVANRLRELNFYNPNEDPERIAAHLQGASNTFTNDFRNHCQQAERWANIPAANP